MKNPHQSLVIKSLAQNFCSSDKAGGCFIKGTRVHTKDGLKRIEEIKIGDEVLSSPESGRGRAKYKRVINTFCIKKKHCALKYDRKDREQARVLFVTGKHLFWVAGAGWTATDQLKKLDVLRMVGGIKVKVASQYPVYRTNEKNVGWFQRFNDVEHSHGTLIDCANYKPIPSDGHEIFVDADIYESDDPYLKVDVYNLEVEDYHTYFVTGDGIFGT